MSPGATRRNGRAARPGEDQGFLERGEEMDTLLLVPVVRLRNGPYAGRLFEVQTALRVGRHPYNEISLPDPAVSRYHCWITATDTGVFVEDLASSNGTWINGRQVRVRQKLNPGDILRVGHTELLFSQEE